MRNQSAQRGGEGGSVSAHAEDRPQTDTQPRLVTPGTDEYAAGDGMVRWVGIDVRMPAMAGKEVTWGLHPCDMPGNHLVYAR
jgi:hypothetical protein